MEDIDMSPSTELPSELNESVGEVATPNDKEINFKAIREELAKAKEEREYWRGQATREQPQQRQEDPFNELSEDEWVYGRDVRKVAHALKQENQALRREVQDAITAMQARAEHPDWNDVVTRNIPELTKENPLYAEMIRGASNPYEAAYLLAKLKGTETPNKGYGDRIEANARKPIPPHGGTSKLSQTDYYAQMSDEDFMKVVAKNMA